LDVAQQNLREFSNCEFCCASVDSIPLPDNSADFAYSLGVLHHVPDTERGITDCVRKLKPGAPFLLYLYYAFDNRPAWFRIVWKASDVGRQVICTLPFSMKSVICDVIAACVYWPIARTARLLEKLGMNVSSHPLSAYRRRSFYAMRTDALDRFGTRLEQRFTRNQMQAMMEAAGLDNIRFSDVIFWCALGYRRRDDT
jgi:ubiquinone/menaquinone biosynthesis C-methylase UbiE